MKKSILALALAGAFAAMPVLGQTVEQKLQVLQQEIDDLKAQTRKPAAPGPQASPYSLDYNSMLDRSSGLANGGTNVVGYGEMAYSKFRESGNATADLTRFVFGFNHRFDERLTFHSEVEIEHAVVSADDHGEVEVEQAWVNYKLNDGVNFKGGLFLIPIGILNETHEPPTYYGVMRNQVETRIIPTTWRELGVGTHGIFGEGFRYDVGVTTSFDSGKLDDSLTGIRSAHQEGQEANARNLAVYGALNYRLPGLLIGGGVFSGDTGQNGASNPALQGVAARFTIWDIHAQYRIAGLDLQGLYTAGTLGDADKVTAALFAADPATAFAAPKSMKGWYAQAAYHVYKKGNFDVAPFVRYERIDIRQAEDPANGLLQDPRNNERIKTVGVNFWVHPQVVLKADVQRYETDKTQDAYRLGLGFMF
ncbi:MAG TPA: porin [Burkholderiales bacterium]|nr:porin [Burkholderiales bacterium]